MQGIVAECLNPYHHRCERSNLSDSDVPGEGGLGGSNPPPRNSEDIGGVLDRTSKKNRRLDFLL